MYYPCSKNKGTTDQLCSYCTADLRLCFRISKLLVFLCSGSKHVDGYYYQEHNKVKTFFEFHSKNTVTYELVPTLMLGTEAVTSNVYQMRRYMYQRTCIYSMYIYIYTTNSQELIPNFASNFIIKQPHLKINNLHRLKPRRRPASR